MKVNSDFRDLLHALNAANVRYLVVGGYALMVHTEPRFTKDLDVWIDPEPSNAVSLLNGLAAFGAPLQGISADDFTHPDVYFQIGIDPVRIDIMTSIDGVAFTGAWERRVSVDFGGVTAPVLGRHDLVMNKTASGRRVDKADLKRLKRKPVDSTGP